MPSGARRESVAVQTLLDATITALAVVAAYLLRFEGFPPPEFVRQLTFAVPAIAVTQAVFNHAFDVYRLKWRFIGIVDIHQIVRPYIAIFGLLVFARAVLPPALSLIRLPLSVIVIQFMAAFGGALAARVLWQLFDRRAAAARTSPDKAAGVGRRILLLGAGSIGSMVAKDMTSQPDIEVVGFLDDDPAKLGMVVAGAEVLGPLAALPDLAQRRNVDTVVVCMATMQRDTAKTIWRICDELGLASRIIPPLGDLIRGDSQVTVLRSINLEDLLARETMSAEFFDEALKHYQGRRVLIAGAGGSIGSEIARQIARLKPERLLLLDKDENGLYELHREMNAWYPDVQVEYLVRNTRFRKAIAGVFETWKPQVVFHAAAHKHLGLMEDNVCEAALNNIAGTQNLVEESVKHNVDRFVFVSSDKAVKPASVMGATKRLGEMVLQMNGRDAAGRFCAVRFGNVMGSRGSVIPLFLDQIRKGQPVTVSSPEMTRYFMTIPEAAQLVILAGTLAHTGEVFVLDMADPIRIHDLAHDLIELSGMRPGQDVEIVIKGARPGENLTEELVTKDEKVERTRIRKIFIIEQKGFSVDVFRDQVERIKSAAADEDAATVAAILEETGIGFTAPKP